MVFRRLGQCFGVCKTVNKNECDNISRCTFTRGLCQLKCSNRVKGNACLKDKLAIVIFVFIRMAMKLSCTMYLEKFPLDYQICYIKISTCELLRYHFFRFKRATIYLKNRKRKKCIDFF